MCSVRGVWVHINFSHPWTPVNYQLLKFYTHLSFLNPWIHHVNLALIELKYLGFGQFWGDRSGTSIINSYIFLRGRWWWNIVNPLTSSDHHALGGRYRYEIPPPKKLWPTCDVTLSRTLQTQNPINIYTYMCIYMYFFISIYIYVYINTGNPMLGMCSR